MTKGEKGDKGDKGDGVRGPPGPPGKGYDLNDEVRYQYFKLKKTLNKVINIFCRTFWQGYRRDHQAQKVTPENVLAMRRRY